MPADDWMPLGAGPAITWQDTFVDMLPANGGFKVVLVWAPWNPHSTEAIESLREVFRAWRNNGGDVTAFTAVEPSSWSTDIARMRATVRLDLPEIQIRPGHLARSGAANQMPTYLLFSNDRLIGSLLGAQAPETLAEWVKDAHSSFGSKP